MDKMTKAMEEAMDKFSVGKYRVMNLHESDIYVSGFKMGWNACHKELKGW